MPLILLGLILIVGLVIYGLIKYASSDDETDTRPVRERYSHIFDKMKKGANYTVVDDDDEDSAGRHSGDGHTMYFPTDAEIEKRKRNIH